MVFILRLFIFIFGLVVGSFLNCVIYRLETKKNLKGRSFCPFCKHTLNWRDLVPVFSFIALKGRCRYCGKKISMQYPLVELATGIIFLIIFNFQFSIFNFQTIINTTYLLIVSSLLIIIFVYDLKHFLIPDIILFPAIVIVFLYNATYNIHYTIYNSLFFAFGASAFFLAIFLISMGKWLGFGDVKLVFFMGFFLGYPKIVTALFLSFFIGAAIGIGLILLKKKTMKSEIPFGPFLIAGTFISLFLK